MLLVPEGLRPPRSVLDAALKEKTTDISINVNKSILILGRN